VEIQTVKAKKLAQKLLEIYPERFTSDFNTNKKAPGRADNFVFKANAKLDRWLYFWA